MTRHFRNYSLLTSHGETKARSTALQCLDAALAAAGTYEKTYKAVSLEGEELVVGGKHFKLGKDSRIFVVGAGKGTLPVARALDEILGNRITEGVVLVKEEDPPKLANIRVMTAGHPVPNKNSLEGGREIERIANGLTDQDIVFSCLSGGCSALLALPVEGVSLDDLITVNKLLLDTGARIDRMNAVRKHISRIKGGLMLEMLQPAKVITLTQFTAPDNFPWPDPVLADPSTFEDAIEVLRYYEIWAKTPEGIRKHLQRGLEDPRLETPKDLSHIETHMFDTGNQVEACEAAAELGRKLGYNATVLSTKIEGEAKDIGRVLAGIAKEIRLYGRPIPPPCVLTSAGEATVSVAGASGVGGPNQELALGFADSAGGYEGVCLVSIDSEGTDGPTDIAGGIADGLTRQRAEQLGLNLADVFKHHDSTRVLDKLEDTVITGPTGTNVVNLRVLVVE